MGVVPIAGRQNVVLSILGDPCPAKKMCPEEKRNMIPPTVPTG